MSSTRSLNKTARLFLLMGASFSFIGVALGAFAAHSLKASITPYLLDVFQTGVHYQMIHSISLIVLSLFPHKSVWLDVAGWSFIIGILLFSGSLYALSLSGVTQLGIITPFGGFSFLIGWFSLLIFAWKNNAK